MSQRENREKQKDGTKYDAVKAINTAVLTVFANKTPEHLSKIMIKCYACHCVKEACTQEVQRESDFIK